LRFRFTRHVEDKIQTELLKFGIDKIVVIETIRNPDETLYDTKTGRYIAINYSRRIAVIYERNLEILIITVIYCSIIDRLVSRRKRSGRWI